MMMLFSFKFSKEVYGDDKKFDFRKFHTFFKLSISYAWHVSMLKFKFWIDDCLFLLLSIPNLFSSGFV